MARPASGYFNPDDRSERWPGISTIAGYGKDSRGLMIWAHRLGQRGIDMDSELAREAGAGTLTHDLFEAYLLHKPEPSLDQYTPQQIEKARTSFGAAKTWAEQSKLEVTHTEVTLLSRKYRAGGTLDAASRIGGKRAILDWKTSPDIYPEMVVQVKGYGLLWDETFPEDPVTGGYHVIRFDKLTGGFAHYWWPELEAAGRAFALKRELYDIARTMKTITL